jgi:hypothetical protein
MKKGANQWRNAIARAGEKALKAHFKEADIDLKNAAAIKIEVDELMAAPLSDTGEAVKTASRPFLFSDWDEGDFRKSKVCFVYLIFSILKVCRASGAQTSFSLHCRTTSTRSAATKTNLTLSSTQRKSCLSADSHCAALPYIYFSPFN